MRPVAPPPALRPVGGKGNGAVAQYLRQRAKEEAAARAAAAARAEEAKPAKKLDATPELVAIVARRARAGTNGSGDR